jgi:putative peptidoglycan lipid II flippase
MGPLGHGGLALANSLAVSAEVVTLLLVLRTRLGGVDGRAMLNTLGKVLLMAGLMAVAVLAALALGGRAGLGALPLLAAGVLVGGLVYIAAGLLLRLQALRWAFDALRR